ncbi:MAG: MATE family efflux transporter [Lachnospiraceae bacterium]
MSELVTTGFSMGLMNSIFSIGSVILQGSINTLGTSIIAAHTAARRIVMIGNMPLASIASANATFVSQNFGAGRMDRIRDGIRKSSILCLIWSALFLVMILTLAKPLVKALAGTDDPVIMSNALMNLHINMIFFFPLECPADAPHDPPGNQLQDHSADLQLHGACHQDPLLLSSSSPSGATREPPSPSRFPGCCACCFCCFPTYGL